MRKLVLVSASLAALASTVKAADLATPCWGAWLNGVSWGQAFPEREQFGALAPRYAAAAVAGTDAIKSPEALIQDWHRLPNDLHQQDCGTDSLGQRKRCLGETFQGAGEYAGTFVTAHFDTIGGSWHFMGFDVH